MPQKKNNSGPPPVMTWGKAFPTLALALVFDAVRFMFEQFWFFAPALATVWCSSKVGDTLNTWTVGLLGAKTASLACGAAAAVVGVFGAVPIETFGVIMAMATGLLGFLAVWLRNMTSNARIFKENSRNILWLMLALGLSEVPFVGSLPTLTTTTWTMYRRQIKSDSIKFAAYQKEQEAQEKKERNEMLSQLAQMRAARENQTKKLEVENAARAVDAANDAEYSPQDSDRKEFTPVLESNVIAFPEGGRDGKRLSEQGGGNSLQKEIPEDQRLAA